ncbi:DegT/DnrJ/EryC1/StrS aminotransferase family protein [Candidatus Saccharibacteria bacterium]|nr:DegT/DnrJ/EryC1/StrS aminotransferase family protein [Candidatus Saccharibacteria bacterium]
MKKHYYLGLNARRRHAWRHLLTIGRKSDYTALEKALASKYGGKAVLSKNGRTGLVLALKTYFNMGDKIIVNGFTCYAVIEAIKAAGCVPVYADIDKRTLNFNMGRVLPDGAAGIIVQNTLGIPVDINAVEKFAKKRGLTIIEDLAHSVGVKYSDGREAGTVGAATVLSFGKDKAIDTISGGAVVLRNEFAHLCTRQVTAPSKPPKFADTLRERLYPLLAAMVRGLTHIHMGGVLMRVFLKLRLVERSADNRLDLVRRMPYFEAKLALRQLDAAHGVDREFYLVRDRNKCLTELKAAGYHLAGFWYEKPVSPERYYKKVHFPEEECREAVFVAEHIINVPTYYSQKELAPALKIIRKYEIGGKND